MQLRHGDVRGLTSVCEQRKVSEMKSSNPPDGVNADDEALLASIERRGVGHRGKLRHLPRSIFEPGPKDPTGSVVAALLDERGRSSR